MYRAILALSLSALASGLGCTESEADACSDDQIYDDGACIPKPAATAGSSSGSAAGAPASSDGGAPASSAGGAPPASDGGAGSSDAPFGASCADHPDCMGTTDYCAVSPVAPSYCTVAGCDEAPELCPEGWACFDVSQFKAGEPWICMQPL